MPQGTAVLGRCLIVRLIPPITHMSGKSGGLLFLLLKISECSIIVTENYVIDILFFN